MTNPVIFWELFMDTTRHTMRKIRIRSSERGLETTFYKSDGTVETKTSKPEPLEFVDTFNCEDDNLNSFFSEYSGSTASIE